MSEELKFSADEAYSLIDRFLRNNLDDTDYATFSDALEVLSTPDAAEAGKDAWQPIETAPKDGTVILVLDKLEQKPWHYECMWNGFYWYHGFGDAWPDPTPTHWMPLPAAPLGGGER